MKTSKITLSALVVTLLLTFGSCNNNDDNPNPNPGNTSCVISSETDDANVKQIDYEYDSQNRPVKIQEYTGGTPDGYENIAYSAGKVVVTSYTQANVKESEFTYTLDGNNRATKLDGTTTQDDGGFTMTSIISTTFQYDSDGHIIKSVTTGTETSTDPQNPGPFNSTITTDFTYTNGNLTTMKMTIEAEGSPVQFVTTDTYEYYTDKNETRNIGDFSEFFLGKGSKNLIKKVTSTSSGVSSVTDYVYETNSDKQITKQTTTSNGVSDVTKYVYTCK
ncbi:hypothetical protein NF867_05000 [Solitalea sp. MAHUQ-68]|uniref:DUF4595 domain-containing protein n=1 Tax=Solitalea agri TaxID=2953739 RepID=A0A9X2F5D1_9SPHI|nr:hypothetical protein [Solitalea agri]MCO4292218.1 hypothetical protein [Solitalea agri]